MMKITDISTDGRVTKVTVAMDQKEALGKGISLDSIPLFVDNRSFRNMMVKLDKNNIYLKVPPKMLKAFPQIKSKNVKWTTDGKFIVIKVE